MVPVSVRVLHFAAPTASQGAWRRLRHFAVLVLTSALFLCGFGPPRLADSDVAPRQRLTANELANLLAVQPPSLAAHAAMIYDVEAQRILWQQNADMEWAPASLTKLMAALLVLEQGNFAAQVTVTPADMIGAAVMGLQPGETLTVDDLLWGLLVPSGNDAAMALARSSAGTVESFVERMNRRAAELGLRQSRFLNPHGLDEDGHVSSAQDLLTLALLDWQYARFREIVGTASATVAGHELRNTNELLGLYPGAIGVKTGTTDMAGQCLVAAIDHGGRVVFLVILGSSDRYDDARKMDAYYDAQFAWFVGNARAEQALNRVYDDTGAVHYLTAVGAAPAQLMRRGELGLVQSRRVLNLPAADAWEKGAVVGQIEWWLGSQRIGEQELVVR